MQVSTFALEPVAAVALAHLAATGFMVGLIWTIHVVHYPLFRLVGEPYRPYQDEHMSRITRLLLLPWGIEVLTALWLFVSARDEISFGLRLGGLVLVAFIVAVTGGLAAPRHGELLDAFDADVHRRLMRADAVRTWLWTARLVLAVMMVAQLLD